MRIRTPTPFRAGQPASPARAATPATRARRPPTRPRCLALSLAAAFMLLGGAAPVDAATRTWNAGCNNNDWTCTYSIFGGILPLGTTNWSGTYNLPANGDSLVFAGSSGLTNTNTFSSLSIANLSFASNAGAFVLNGNALTVTGNITNSSASNAQTINAPIRVGGNQVWTGGAAGLVLGDLSFSGSTARTITGSGKITLTGDITNSSSAAQTIKAPLIIGTSQIWDGGSAGLVFAGGHTASVSAGNTPLLGVSGTLSIKEKSRIESHIGFVYGLVTVEDESAWKSSEDLKVGYYGGGALDIKSGSTVSSTDGYVGDIAGHTGVVTVSDAKSVWKNTSSLSIGYSGNGTLNIQNGGAVSSGLSYVGLDYGSTGVVTVTGTNSAWNNSGYLFVGKYGNGTLNINSGGAVSSDWGYVGWFLGGVGVGVVTVSNPNSVWNNSQALYVGHSGNGTLTINSGGTVKSENVIIGDSGTLNLGPDGVLRVRSFTSSGAFNWTGGTLNYTGPLGASLASGMAGLGSVVNLLPGQVLKVDTQLTVGSNVVLLSGGSLQAGWLSLAGGLIAATGGHTLDMSGIGSLSGYGTVSARIAGGRGKTISASGGTLSLGDLGAIGGFAYDGQLIVGTQQVALNAADRAQLGSRTTLGAGGRLAAINGSTLGSGRTLSFTGNASILGNFTNNGTVSGTGGALTFLNDVDGAGSFAGNIVFRAGFNPGNSPATVNHGGGDVSFDSTSVLTMEILGSTPGTQYDQLVGINKLTFNGRLSLVFGNGFAPVAGSNFRLFSFNTFAGSLASDRIDVTGFDRTQLDFSNLAQDGSFSVAAVPEPGTCAMFAAGLGLMGFMVRRRRRTPPA